MMREIELIESFGHILAYEVPSPRALKTVVPELPAEHYNALLQWWENSNKPSFVYVADFYVSSELRGRGLGRELMEKFLSSTQETLILVAGSFDTPETLDLVYFYENYEFSILEPLDYPLMIKERK